MEKHQSPEWMKHRRESVHQQPSEHETISAAEAPLRGQELLDVRRIVEEHLKEKAKRESRRKWTGRGLIVVGVLTMLGSCPLQMVSMMAFHTMSTDIVILALGLIGGGIVLTMLRPKLKDTNEALLIAMKYGNTLTAARLAFELDISFDKAEKIIKELVRSGIAEIDLDRNDPEQAITYKIRGL